MIKTFIILFFLLPNFVMAAVILRDNFEYTVNRNDSDKSAFVSSGGWTGVKSEPSENGNGFLYTTTSIDGFSGTFPGATSSRVLMMEAVPLSEGYQTDFYLQFGDASVADLIPGNVWFQFWIYIQQYGDQYSRFCRDQGKFLYPCNGSYGCQTGHWIWQIWTASVGIYDVELDNDDGVYPILHDAGGSTPRSVVSYESTNKVGNNITNDYLHPNKWYLVKLRFDTSVTNSIYQMWVREQGSSAWVQWANWTGGQDGLTFTTSTLGGHSILKMPTTWGKVNCPDNEGDCYDAWVLLDDFVMAEAESDLPTYTDGANEQTLSGGIDIKGGKLE